MSLLDDLAGMISDAAAADRDPKLYGVVVGRVIDVADPLFLSRVRVQLPYIDDLDLSPWVRVAMPSAGMASGMYWMPNPEDEVLVAFENGDVNAPYIIGCLWSAVAVPPMPSPAAQIRLMRTPLGNQIMFTETPPTITVTTASMTESIIMSPAGVTIMAGASVIALTPEGITLTAPSITLTATDAISLISGGTALVAGVDATTVGSPASPTNVSGMPVAIN